MRDKPRYKLPTEDRLTRAAVHYLERYPSSEVNLRKVLERKVLKACLSLDEDLETYSDLVRTVVEKCVRAGLVNDRSFAETKTASLRRRGASSRKIEAKLAAKGVDRETIRSVLDQDAQTDDDAAKAFARRKRLGPYRKATEREDRRDKDLAAMCRAGFSFELARRVVDGEIDTEADASGDAPAGVSAK
ncbi:regulatory protein RecX [Roseibium aggregatum]|uniref:Regulatory protein RecX n=1 Tax=Roseibium aggregatum TaxID=187304 RepID=A0A939EDM5_9HYPH|nr:regulatory protein RecX [Roseibium aggregatum]MBN9670627.1 regulatory protein RecX [Roseibium aggregatum]